MASSRERFSYTIVNHLSHAVVNGLQSRRAKDRVDHSRATKLGPLTKEPGSLRRVGAALLRPSTPRSSSRRLFRRGVVAQAWSDRIPPARYTACRKQRLLAVKVHQRVTPATPSTTLTTPLPATNAYALGHPRAVAKLIFFLSPAQQPEVLSRTAPPVVVPGCAADPLFPDTSEIADTKKPVRHRDHPLVPGGAYDSSTRQHSRQLKRFPFFFMELYSGFAMDLVRVPHVAR